MSHVRVDGGNPFNCQKIASIAINKSVLKEFKNDNVSVVYMNDGQEFQIMLYNPFTDTIGASISLNGKKVSDSHIVLRPGERVWLDRYIDSNNKLVFGTYNVNGASSSARKAIEYNGDIKIEIYHELVYRNYRMICDSICYDDSFDEPLGASRVYTSSISDTYNTSDTSATSATFASTSTHNPLTTSATYANTLGIHANTSGICGSASTKKSSTIETGRIEKGRSSSQKINEVYNMNFSSWPSETFCFKILPLSQKPVCRNDIAKKYCTNCGRKLKQEFRFCPSCGAKA